MTLPQKQALRELLKMAIEHGFKSHYPLKPIADKLGITEPLYDNNTNTGLLWEFGPHGQGLIYAAGDYDMARIIEGWTYHSQKPVG